MVRGNWGVWSRVGWLRGSTIARVHLHPGRGGHRSHRPTQCVPGSLGLCAHGQAAAGKPSSQEAPAPTHRAGSDAHKGTLRPRGAAVQMPTRSDKKQHCACAWGRASLPGGRLPHPSAPLPPHPGAQPSRPPHLQHLLGRGLAPPLQLQDAGLELMALLVQGGLTVLQPLQNLPVFLLQFPQVRLLLLPQEAMNVLEVSPDFLSPIRYLLLESRQDAQQVGATQRPPRDE